MRKRIYLPVVCLVTTVLLVTEYIPKLVDPEKSRSRRTGTKYILYWTEMFHRPDFNLGLGGAIFENCSVNNCYATNNRTFLPVGDFDALLFHGVEYDPAFHGKPGNRSARQIYIYSNQEAPTNTPLAGGMKGFYNWTMTYRSDSDIIRPYGVYEHKTTSYKLPSTEEIARKSKKIAWLVSNCHTHSSRNRLYENIKDHMDVDVYGNCGNLTCSKEAPEECFDFLERNYKFYLSFENSYCRDYVTEKLFNPLRRNLIPIVYGQADYSQIAPPRSVIDSAAFGSARSLVAYLMTLDEDPAKYAEYFEWKKSYVIDTSNRLALCKLCEKLNGPLGHKVYDDVDNWWRYTGERKLCKMGRELPKIVVEDSEHATTTD